MEKDRQIYEIILTCDAYGLVREILFPTYDISDYFIINANLFFNIDPESVSKALTFLVVLNKDGFISNYEINFNNKGSLEKLYFSGYLKNETCYVIISTRVESSIKLDEELMKINNEQTNHFRMLLKEKQKQQTHHIFPAFNHFDEISKLNNELLNTQRELAKKNQELSILNKQLEALATIDPLTGLFNRRLLFQKFNEEKRRSKRFEYSISLAVIDINNFKRVNDQLGHAYGDELLVSFSNLIKKYTRESLDLPFRIGGDEFLIIFSNCHEAEANVVLERLDDAFSKLTDIATLAYGVITMDQSCDEDLDRCIIMADALMFEDKYNKKFISK